MSTRKDGIYKKQRDSDKGQLLLSEPQFFRAVQQIKAADIRIALVHHPPASNWFKQFDAKMQKAKIHEFDFVLRGHEHRSEYLGLNEGGGEWQHIASGALYTRPARSTGCNVVCLDFERSMTSVYRWRYYDDNKFRWDIDTQNTWRSGRTEAVMPTRLIERIRSAT
jgi:hypothetical protein